MDATLRQTCTLDVVGWVKVLEGPNELNPRRFTLVSQGTSLQLHSPSQAREVKEFLLLEGYFEDNDQSVNKLSLLN